MPVLIIEMKFELKFRLMYFCNILKVHIVTGPVANFLWRLPTFVNCHFLLFVLYLDLPQTNNKILFLLIDMFTLNQTSVHRKVSTATAPHLLKCQLKKSKCFWMVRSSKLANFLTKN